jgi:hypothetical protein
LTILISPLLPQACKSEWMLVMQEKEEGLLPTACALPLVEVIRGDNTALCLNAWRKAGFSLTVSLRALISFAPIETSLA